MKRKLRRKTGSMIVLALCFVAAVIIPLCILLCNIGPFLIFSGRAQNVVDAAGLIAARDLSRIVVNDPTFGYVSLSNHNAVGRATRAQDGEPLPVTGINTLVGTVRQNAIVAETLQNDTMNSLVSKDLSALQITIRNLNNKLNESVGDEVKTGKCLDIEGQTVTPAQDVKEFLSANLPKNLRLESVRLSLGWLQGGSETNIAVPQPVRLARLKAEAYNEGQYEAFTDVPVGRKNFSFAGIGSNAHLVSTRNFQEADDAHINSIIRIDCTLVSNDAAHSKIECVTCCQPYSLPDQATRGSMTVRFSGRPVPGILSWNEFLSKGCFQDNKITNYDVLGGDYPFDKKAKMYLAPAQSSTSQEFSEHFYYWLRSEHMGPRLDAIFAMVNEPFLASSNQVYAYEVASDGAIGRKVMSLDHFTRAVTADGQSVAMADTKIKSRTNAVIFFRDNVMRQNTAGGKHAGQPLAGYPIANLDGWIDQNQLAQTFCKRSNSPGGLALDIEIGGTGDSTAQRDVLSMRQKCMSRKI